jgi:hypothetical protein
MEKVRADLSNVERPENSCFLRPDFGQAAQNFSRRFMG